MKTIILLWIKLIAKFIGAVAAVYIMFILLVLGVKALYQTVLFFW